MKTLIYILLISILTGMAPYTIQGQNTSVYEFLMLPGSARLAALGPQQPAILQADFTTLQANPALLDSAHHQQLAASYLNYLAGIHMGTMGGAFNLDQIGTIAAQLRYVNYGTINRTNTEGETLGEFTPQDISLQFSLSRELLPNLRGGTQISLIHQNYDRFTSSGISIDGGLTYRLHQQEALIGLSFHNLGKQITTFSGVQEPLPFGISLGFSQQLQYLPMRLQIGVKEIQDWNPDSNTQQGRSFGELLIHKLMISTEWDLGDHLQARLGYQPETNSSLGLDRRIDPAGIRAGIGVNIRSFIVDIGYHSYSSLGAITMLTIQTNWDRLR